MALKSILIFCFFLAAPFCGGCQNWVTVKIDSLASLDFPAQPTSKIAKGNNVLMVKDSTGFYMSMAIKMGPDNGGASNRADAYNEYVEAIKSRNGARDVVVKDFKINSLSGKEVEYTTTGLNNMTVVGKTRLVFVNGNLYTYSYAVSGKVFQASVTKFLTSFKLNAQTSLSQSSPQTWHVHSLAYELGRTALGVFAIFAFYRLLTFSMRKRKTTS